MSVIQLQNIVKSFKSKIVLQNFSLTVSQGEMVALIGPSGSGKTTILNMIGLIDAVDKGNYTLFGKPAPKPNSKQALTIIRKEISYLFQNFALVDYLSVEDNLLMALKYVQAKREEKLAIINEALIKVGLSGYQSLKVFEISGGEQQRVALARAIIKPSSVILADEPTGSLDERNRDEILSILRQLNKQGKTIIIVTHDKVVANQCDRLIELTPLSK